MQTYVIKRTTNPHTVHTLSLIQCT